jgi:gamma-glutamyltranspeptidase/glutathione hydrolase
MLLRRILLIAAPVLLASGAVAKEPAPQTKFDAGMVSAADPRAAEAGAQMLRAGGSATDAALATLIALTVVEPQSSGIGGGGFLVLDDGKGGIETFDGRETAPAAATPDWFKADGQYLTISQAIPGGISVGIPGNVAMMADVHARHGKLKWRALFQPAIKLARDGFAVTPRLNQFLTRAKGNAGFTEAGRALYFGADGAPLPVGTVIRNPQLAAFLTTLANKGPKAFYTGNNARQIADTVSNAPRTPAPLTLADLAAYRAKQRAPICSTYRAWKVCGMGPPSSGATTVLGILGLLQRFDMGSLGKDNPVSWHLMAEAMRLTYADRDRYLADADFVPVPVAGLLAPDYIAQRSQLIAPDRTMAEVSPGQPTGAAAQADALSPEVPSTSHFVAVDRQGSAVSLTSTIEGPFGSGLMVGGYFLNNQLTDFSMVPQRDGKWVANRVQAGKRPLSSMSPTLVYAPDGGLRLVIGAAGGKTIPAQVTKAIIGVIDWNLTAQEAIALPVIYAPGGNAVIVEPGSSLEAMIPALKALGHTEVRAATLAFKANAIEVVDGKLAGAADPRSEGKAVSQ